MKICNIKIENFKAFNEVEMPINPNFNIIIGENNIGKSTLFEAIHLWMLGYNSLIQANGRNFYGRNTPRYIAFDQLYFLRLSTIDDVFNSKVKIAKITINILLNERIYALKIIFEKPTSINFYLRVKYEGEDFRLLSEELRNQGLNLSNSIFIYHTRPVFNALKNEPFYNNAQLMKKITLGKSYDVIRNKILKGDPDRRFTRLQERISNVFNTPIVIRFKNKNKSLQDEEFVRITIQIGDAKEVDISLVGSGILQVIDIFSTLEFISRREGCLNILLIDEPDSHIHSNIQAALLDELRRDVNNQHFIITHNDRLIHKANEGELYYLNKAGLDVGRVSFISPFNYSSITSALASNILTIDENHRNKIIVVTEGKTDKRLLEIAWQKNNPEVDCPFMFISSGIQIDENTRTGNADSVRRTIQTLSTFFSDLKIIGLFDNDREGYEQYNSLQRGVFEPRNFQILHRKHLDRNIFGLVLPIPNFRQNYINDNSITQRYFVIEHYFSDDILREHNMINEPILQGTEVYQIQGDKDNFSERVNNLPQVEFQNFNLLFEYMLGLFDNREE
ncbi:AAA family ATPase [Empedobacter falsenii]